MLNHQSMTLTISVLLVACYGGTPPIATKKLPETISLQQEVSPSPMTILPIASQLSPDPEPIKVISDTDEVPEMTQAEKDSLRQFLSGVERLTLGATFKTSQILFSQLGRYENNKNEFTQFEFTEHNADNFANDRKIKKIFHQMTIKNKDLTPAIKNMANVFSNFRIYYFPSGSHLTTTPKEIEEMSISFGPQTDDRNHFTNYFMRDEFINFYAKIAHNPRLKEFGIRPYTDKLVIQLGGTGSARLKPLPYYFDIGS
jgi:hypothetical protein